MQALQRGDYQTAYAAFSEMAQQGDPDGVFHLGVMHEAGEGVQPNLQEAYARYYMAGTRGHPMAAQYARDLEQTMPPAVVGKIRSQVDARWAGKNTRPPAAPRDPGPQAPFNGQYDRPKGSVGSTPPYWPMSPKPEPRTQSQPNNYGSQHDRYPQPNPK